MIVDKLEHKLVEYTAVHTWAEVEALEEVEVLDCSTVLGMLVECIVLDRTWDSC